MQNHLLPLLSLTPNDGLAMAIKSHNFSAVEYFIEQGAKANYLHLCVQQNDRFIFSYLLNKGFNVDFEDENGKTPLFHCAQLDYVQIGELCLEHGCDIEHQNGERKTALFFVHSIEMLSLFLDYGCSFDSISGVGSPWSAICSQPNGFELLDFLEMQDYQLPEQRDLDFDLLEVSSTSSLRFLFEHGFSAKGSEKHLLLVCDEGEDLERIQLLLCHGAEFREKQHCFGFSDEVHYLIDHPTCDLSYFETHQL